MTEHLANLVLIAYLIKLEEKLSRLIPIYLEIGLNETLNTYYIRNLWLKYEIKT